ncbi:MAG: hypothetical protein OHK0024_00180 [Thalassobaculales bacterium]
MGLSACTVPASQRDIAPAAVQPLPPQPAVTPPTQGMVAVPVPPAPRAKPTAIPPLASAAPAAAPPLDPGTLIGLTREEARRLLGPPVATRERPPAEAWTWRDGDCRIEVLFYPEINSREFRALAVDAGADEASGGRCLGRLRARHAG